ncbi:MAG TPA: hypothetical protein VN624_01665 [Rhodanobacter sp.]|nr:hypothetical protein [Rhodanobacter sp.]
MNRFHGLWLLIFAAASACQPPQALDQASERSSHNAVVTAASQTPPAATSSTQSIGSSPANHIRARIPANFSQYASTPVGNGGRCVVGATTDDDGMNQRPVVYITDTRSKKTLWVDQLILPPDTFQSRATHCTSSDRALFLLLQSDTQPEQTLSQTLLRVLRLDPATGEVQSERDIRVPGAFSAWVPEGSSRFQWDGNALIVSGHDKPQASTDSQETFTVRMNHDLAPVKENKL